MDTSTGTSPGSAAAEALRRELYWAPPPERAATAPRFHGPPVSPLAARWRSLGSALRWEYDEMFPPEPLLRIGRGSRLRIKRVVWRYMRPISRRYDRIAGDLAELGFETAQALGDDRGDGPHAMGAASSAPPPPGEPGQGRPQQSPPAIRERIAKLEAQVAELQAQLGATPKGGSR